MMILEAVSIRQPYGFAILRFGKGLENRGQKDDRVPVLCRHRGPILIHSSSWFQPGEVLDQARDCVDVAQRNGVAVDDLRPITLQSLKDSTGGIIGRCHVVGAVKRCASMGPGSVPTIDNPSPIWTVSSVFDLPIEQRRWFCGPFAAVLALVEPFEEVIPCKGALGVFRVPGDVAAEAARARIAR